VRRPAANLSTLMEVAPAGVPLPAAMDSALRQEVGALSQAVTDLPVPPWVIMALIVGFYLALGTFMEGFSMIVTTIPVIFPVVKALGYDPIWFGVVVTMLVEIALISPPDGTVLYVLQGMRGNPGPITDVFKGVMPFLLVYLVAIVLLMVFPQIALWLVNRSP